MADALLGIVIGNLQTFVQNELGTFWGVDSEIQKLSSNLTAIRAVLQDAEEKQITNHAVKDWLQKLTDAAYVLDDILDSCSIESDRLQSEEEKCGFAFARKAHTSACLTRFHPSTVLFRRDTGKRMKSIVERFHNIDEERRRFEFRAGVIERQQEEDDHECRQTSSAITEPHIYARDQDKEKIVEFLSRHDSSSYNLSVYPVVGMGGLGKTTLVRWVFNDDRVVKHFDLRIWVCVSNDFNIMKILQSIVESATGHNPNLSTFESLQKKVQELLQGKKYLLVLDDVWNEDLERWEKLKSALQCGGGTKGASILVTTRLEGVASMMGTCSTHHLLPLSEDENWLLFKHYAFGPNREERPELVAIGKEIVKKCVGSPLASKALGSILLNKNEEKQWLNIKESKFWDIPEGDAVMRALRISYFNLKLPLRHCFTFCAIYPDDFRISKQEVIHLWMANGLIQSRGNLEVEDVGNEAWEELYRRSFFQEVNTGLSGTITFKIHDLFHELAQSISGEECKASNMESLNNLPSRVHHIYCSESDYVGWVNLDKDDFKKFESLRTFIVRYPRIRNFHRIKAFNCLRALRTNFRQLSALKSLTYLRYLNIYNSDITSLPKFVSSLQKLQVLKLECCFYLSCLPEQLTQLKDLRHLLIESCPSLVVMPPKIGDLKCLKTLNIFIVDLKPGFGLAELHDLQLGGKLHIKGLQNVLTQSDARSANLISKKELNCLYLSWDSNSNSECRKAERVLEALEPHRNLKSFGIKSYMGKQFPNWMINTSILSNLLSVILYDCKNCERLPPLGKLPHLTNLFVSGMRDVKYIDDSYDGTDEKAFKSLRKLTLLGLPNLERMLRDEKLGRLTFLSKLRISCVPKLRLPLLPSIECFEIQGLNSDSDCDGDEDMASFLGAIVQNIPHVKTLSIERFPKLKLLPEELGNLNSLQKLVISNCDEIESFSENMLQGLSSLRTLDIFCCKKLKSLSEGMWHLNCLEFLDITACPELLTLPNNMNQITTLRHVLIASQTTLPKGLQCIPSLQGLTLFDVDSLPDWFGDMTSLQQLAIQECPNIRSLPSSFPRLTNLRELYIKDCPKLEKQCKRVTGEDWQKIAHVPKLDIISRWKVTFCEKLQRRWDTRKDPPWSEFDCMVDDDEL